MVISKGIIIEEKEEEIKYEPKEKQKTTEKEKISVTEALEILEDELGRKGVDWKKETTYGFNDRLLLGYERNRVIFKENEVIVLNLRGMGLQKIPQSLKLFTELRAIELSNNSLEEVDIEILKEAE